MQKEGRIVSFVRSIEVQLESALTFLFAIVAAFASSIFIRLTAPNPYSISNISNIAYGWNPETNYIRVIYIIVSSLAFFFLLQFIKLRFGAKWFRLTIAIFATTIIFVGVMAPVSTSNGIDMFHNGEQLGPTNGFNNGKALFTGLFFLHGAGEDVLVPNLAFHLLNHGKPSIGSYVAMTDLLHLTAAFLLFLLLARLLKSTASFLFATAWFLGTTYAGFAYTKNIAVFVVVYLYWLILTRPPTLRRMLGAYGALGIISSATLFYSIDVGVIMTALAGLVGVLLPFFVISPKGWQVLIAKRSFRLPNLYRSMVIFGGLLLPQVIGLLIIGWHSYVEFIRMSFIEIPKYQGLMFDYPLTGVSAASYLFWLPIIIGCVLAYGVFTMARLNYVRGKYFSSEVVFSAVLLALSLLYLRFGVGRPDTPHVAVSTGLLFITLFYVVELYIEDHTISIPRFASVRWVPILLVGLLFWPQTTWSFPQLFASTNTTLTQIKQYKNLPSRSDSSWLNDEQKQVTKYIKTNSTKKDGLYVLEPEPLYYYLTDRQNPSRFYITWFADPALYTNELLSDLKKDPPKFVIYNGPSPYEISDSIPITERIPEVNQWVLQNYKTKTVIDNTTILSR